MVHFNPTKIEYTAPIDLDKYDNMIDTIAKGNREYVSQLGEFGKVASQLKYNEADAGYFAEEINKVNNAFDSTSYDGKGFYGVDKLIGAINGFYGNKVNWDKIRDNAAYEKFKEGIENNKGLSEDAKNYYRNTITYEGNLKRDSNGDSIIYDKDKKALGTRGWEFNGTIYDTPDYIKVFKEGLNILAEQEGAGTTIVWEDANGNETTRDNAAVGVFKKTTNTHYKKKSVEDIERAVMDVIRASNLMPSIERDFDIAKWTYKNKYKNQAVPNTDITDKFGRELSLDEYLNSKINPLAKDAAYNTRISSTTMNNEYKALKGAKANNDKSTKYLPKGDVGTPSDVEEHNVSETDQLSGRLYGLNNRVKTLLQQARVDINRLNDNHRWAVDYGTIKDEALRKQVRDAVNERNSALDDYNSAISKLTNNTDKELIKFKNKAMPGGHQLDANNKYGKEFINKINQLYSGGDELRISMPDEIANGLKDFVKSARAYGLRTDADGIVLSKKAAYEVGPMLFKLISDLEETNSGAIFSSLSEVSLYKNGEKVGNIHRNSKSGLGSWAEGVAGNSKVDIIDGIGQLYGTIMDSANKIESDLNGSNPSYRIKNYALNYPDSKSQYLHGKANALRDAGAIAEAALVEQQAEEYDKAYGEWFPAMLANHDFANDNISYRTESGIMVDATDENKQTYANILRAAAAKGLINKLPNKLKLGKYNAATGNKDTQHKIVISIPKKDAANWDNAFEGYEEQTMVFNVTNLSMEGQKADSQGFYNRSFDGNANFNYDAYSVRVDDINSLRAVPGSTRTVYNGGLSASMPKMSITSNGDGQTYIIKLGNETAVVREDEAIDYALISDSYRMLQLNHANGTAPDEVEQEQINEISKFIKNYFPNVRSKVNSYILNGINE